MKPSGRHAHNAGEAVDSRAAAHARGELLADELQSGKTYVEATTLVQDIRGLLLKIAVIFICFLVLFIAVFGLFRVPGGDMAPSLHDGDAVMYYRLDKSYDAGDVIAVDYEGTTRALRVIALPGDTVNITDDGLMINGKLQSEVGMQEKTLPYTQGIKFPVVVGSDEVFVLGDAREHATDSRIFGCVNVAETKGSVIGLLRRRSF